MPRLRNLSAAVLQCTTWDTFYSKPTTSAFSSATCFNRNFTRELIKHVVFTCPQPSTPKREDHKIKKTFIVRSFGSHAGGILQLTSGPLALYTTSTRGVVYMKITIMLRRRLLSPRSPRPASNTRRTPSCIHPMVLLPSRQRQHQYDR